MATVQELEAQRARLLAQRDALAARYQAGDNTVLPQIQVINTELRAVVLQIEELQAAAPIVSSGETVANAQLARDDAANSQNPQAAPTTISATPSLGTDTESDPRNVTTGTDGRFRATVETNANPAPTALPGPAGYGTGSQPSGTTTSDGNSNSAATPTNTPGVGAPGEDSAVQAVDAANNNNPNNPNNTAAGNNNIVTLVNQTARPITPQPNVLDKFSSYTYSVSIYLMSPADYQRLMVTKKRYLAGYQLLMQSAGAPQQAGVTTDPNLQDGSASATAGDSTSLTQGRNQFFPLDYYIDELDVKSIIQGKGTGGAHNVAELKFKIVEPNGITLFENLYRATQQYITRGANANPGVVLDNYAAQNYLMVIRFYGYDENGKIVITPGTADPAGRSDSRSLIEKFIPFQFTNITLRASNRLTEYQCEAVCPQNVIGTGQGRGVIPYNIELTATTLQNLFNGNITYVAPGASTAPDKATAAPNPTLASGLTQALNRFQAEQVTSGTYDVADVYKIVISHPELANASIVPILPTGQLNRLSTPMVDATTAAQAKDNDKQNMQNNAKTVSAVAGMSIVQFINLAVRSSDYIYKQQTKIFDKNGKVVVQPTGAKTMAWYRIGVEATPLRTDPKRNDTAYQITYEIAPYGINDLKSEFFPKGKYRGSQKKYNYWFTGENTSVLSFEQDFNYLYYVTVNSIQAPPAIKGANDYREVEKRIFSTNSAETNMGTRYNVNEPGANAADYLYSPATVGEAKLTIVGDPAWIQQGEIWSGVRSTKPTNDNNYDVYFDAFLPDGTINFDAREAVFEINYNQPSDYNLQTGVMAVSGANVKTQTYVYKAKTVTSRFRQGRFTQDLEGIMLLFDEAPKTAVKAVTTAETSTTNTNTQTLAESRLAAAAAASGLTPVGATTVTGPALTTSLAQGTQQILQPATVTAPTLSQLQASPAYITARRNGATPAAALAIATSAFASGTNNYSGTALPGINTTANTGVVKDA